MRVGEPFTTGKAVDAVFLQESPEIIFDCMPKTGSVFLASMMP